MANNDGIKTEVISSHEEFLKKLTKFVGEADKLRVNIDKTIVQISMIASQIRIIGKTIHGGLNDAFSLKGKNPIKGFFDSINKDMASAVQDMTSKTVKAIEKMTTDISTAMNKIPNAAGGAGKGSKSAPKASLTFGINKLSEKEFSDYIRNAKRLIDFKEAQSRLYEKLYGMEGRKPGSVTFGKNNLTEKEFDSYIKNAQKVLDGTMKSRSSQLAASINAYARYEADRDRQLQYSIRSQMRYESDQAKMLQNSINAQSRYENDRNKMVMASIRAQDKFIADQAKLKAKVIRNVQKANKQEITYGENNLTEKEFNEYIGNAKKLADKMERARKIANKPAETPQKTYASLGAGEKLQLGDVFSAITGKDSTILDSKNKMADILRGISEQTGSVMENMKNMIGTAMNNIGTIMKGIIGMTMAAGAAFVGLGYQIKNWGSEILLTTEKVRGFNIALLGMMKTQSGVKQFMGTAFEVAKDFPVGFEQTFQIAKSMSLIQPLRPLLRDAKTSKETMDKVFQITMALNAMEPEWGIQGAMFTLKEALAGDMMSMKRRYEIPINLVTTLDGKRMADVKNDPAKMLEGLYGYLTNIYDKSSMQSLARQFGNILGQIESSWFQFKNKIGEAGFYDAFIDDLVKLKGALQEFMKSSQADEFAGRISNALYSGYKAIRDFMIMVTKEVAGLFGYKLDDSIKSYAETLTQFVEAYANITIGILKTVELNKSKIVGWVKYIYGVIKDFIERTISLVKEWTPTIQSAISGLVDGFKGLRDKLGISNETAAKGLFSVWLFGPGNFASFVASMANTIAMTFGVTVGPAISKTIAKIGIMKSAMTGLFYVGAVYIFIQSLASLKDTFIDLRDWFAGAGTVWDWMMGNTPEKNIDLFNADFKQMNDEFKKTYGADFKVSSLRPEMRDATRMLFPRHDITPSYTGTYDDMGATVGGATINNFPTQKDASEYAQQTKANSLRDQLERLITRFDKLPEYQRQLGASDKLWGSKTELSHGQGFYRWMNNMMGGAPLDSRLATLGPKVNYGEMGNAEKIVIADLGEQLRNLGVVNSGGATYSSAYRPHEAGKKWSQHNYAAPNAIDIPGSAIKNVTDQRAMLEAIFGTASSLGGQVGIEEKVSGSHIDAAILAEVKKKYKDTVSVFTQAPGEGDAAIHVRIKADAAKEDSEFQKVIADAASSRMSKWMGAAKSGVTQSFIEAAPKQAPATAMDELRKVLLTEYVEFQKNMSSISSSYKDNIFQNEFGKILDVFSEKNILFGEAMVNNIKANADVAIKQYDEVLKRVDMEGGPKNNYDRNLVEYAKKAKSNIVQQSGELIARAPTLSREAIKSQLRDKKDVFKYSGVNTFDEVGAMQGMLSEQIAKQTYEGSLDVEKLRNLNDVLSNIHFLMRSGLGMKEAADKLRDVDGLVNKIMVDLLKHNAGGGANGVLNPLGMMMGMTGDAIGNIAKMSLTVGKQVQSTIDALMPAIEKTMKMKAYVDAERTKQGRAQFESAIGLAPNSGEVNRLMEEAQTSGVMNRTLYRSSLDRKIGLLGETETMTFRDSFKLGIDRALADWKNFSEQMVEFGTQAVTELTGIFENNFFDFLSGKIRGLGGLISGVLGSVKDMVLKMVSKLLALQTMKIILGVNVDSSGNFVTGSSGGGAQASGSLEGIFGGKTGGIGGSLMSMGKSALSKVIQGKSGSKGSSGGSLLSGAGLSGALKYFSNTKLSSLSLKGLTKASGINPTMLAAGVALNFLTQPGRLLGGTVDNTQAAKSSFGSLEEWRKSLEEGRAGQASQYMYGGGANLMNYDITPARYYETKSGNGITKKKTKTGQVDVSGFSSSVEGYYKELFGSAMAHYSKQRDIDKMRESSEGSALKEELKYKNSYLGIIRGEYDKLAGKSGKTQDDFKKMDDLRDKIAQTFDDVIKSEKAMAEAFREEALKKKEYDLFMSFGLGKNEGALEQGMLAVQKERLDAMAGTSAWYDANMEYLSSSKDLADKLRDTAESVADQLKSSKIGAIKGGAYAGSAAVASTISSMESNYQKILEGQTGKDIRNQIGMIYGITGTKNFETGAGAAGNRIMVQRNQMGMIPQYQFGSNEEAIRFYEKENKASQTRLYGANVAGEYAYRKQNLFSGASTGTLDELSRRDSMAKAIRDVGGAGAGAEASEEYYNALKEFYDQQFVVADEIKSMMSSGLIEKSSVDIISLMEGSVEDFKNVFLNVQKQFREKQFSQSILETVKGFESGSQFTDIVSQISGMGGLGSSKGYMVDLLGGMGVGADPYQSWYNYALETTQTKIRNAEVGGDEMFTAYNDLFSLLSENAEHLKAKAEATNAKMEESLDAIEQTLKVRLAEERKSMKGDVYFMDTSTYDISPTQIQALRDKLKNNDPDAYMLLEEIKRKVSGTSR